MGSFGGRVRDELLAVELFSCPAEARVLIEDCGQDYDHHRPHSALGTMTPIAFTARPDSASSTEGPQQQRLGTGSRDAGD